MRWIKWLLLLSPFYACTIVEELASKQFLEEQNLSHGRLNLIGAGITFLVFCGLLYQMNWCDGGSFKANLKLFGQFVSLLLVLVLVLFLATAVAVFVQLGLF